LRILAFDTSGPALSAAAGTDGAVLAHRHEALTRGHAERLLPMLTAVLAEAGWAWPTVELVAVTAGPGNFTGLRAGIAVARALGLALGCPVLGLGTLEVVAQAAAAARRRGGADRPVLAVLDARRGELYAQAFAADLAPQGPPALLTRDELGGSMASADVLAGDPAAWAGTGREGIAVGPNACDLLTLASARLAAGAARPTAGTALRPLYLRLPDARVGAGAPLLAAAAS
jgi:tRNA threonylcarbamoyladenosine biosynthesis protein TsaB